VSEPLAPSLLTALSDLMRWTHAAQIPIVVVGGIAASLLGRTRLTRDIDALVSIDESQWQSAVDGAGPFGFQPRIEGAVEFAHRSRVLLLRHAATQIDLDLMIGALPFELDAVANCQSINIEGVVLNVPRVEDLLIMKAIAHRPRDLDDIEGIIAAHPEADLELVRRWVREFATAATMPDLIADFEKLVARSPATP
jgi:hypothetical protein